MHLVSSSLSYIHSLAVWEVLFHPGQKGQSCYPVTSFCSSFKGSTDDPVAMGAPDIEPPAGRISYQFMPTALFWEETTTYSPGANTVLPSNSEHSIATLGTQTPNPSDATVEKDTSCSLPAMRPSSRYLSMAKNSDLKRDRQCFCRLEAVSISGPKPLSTPTPYVVTEVISLSYALSISVRSLSSLAL